MLISSKWVKHLAAVLFCVAAVLLFSPENPGTDMEPAFRYHGKAGLPFYGIAGSEPGAIFLCPAGPPVKRLLNGAYILESGRITRRGLSENIKEDEDIHRAC